MLGRLLFILGCIVVGEAPAPPDLIAHAPRAAVTAHAAPASTRTAVGSVRAPLVPSVDTRAPLYRLALRTAARETSEFTSGFVQSGRASRPVCTS